MIRSQSELEQQFVHDHRELTRGFSELLEALKVGDLETATSLANELDQVAGPHIAFEESELYPEVARHRDRNFARRLYAEHRAALAAIRCLMERDPNEQLSTEHRERLIQQVQTGLDHAISCGTLLSHLTVLDETKQQALCEKLQQLRRQGKRWTELSSESPM